MFGSSATNAILTKSRAKYGKFLTVKNYSELVKLTSIRDTVNYLRQNTWYSDALQNLNESALYRGNIERILTASIHTQIDELCKFDKSVGSNTFRFVDYINDARIILKCTRNLLADNTEDFITDVTLNNKSPSDPLLCKLLNVKKLSDIGDILKTTVFKKAAPVFYDRENFDYPLTEAQLYKIAYDIGFKTISENFGGKEEKDMTELLSLYTEIKNLQMLYRHIKFATDDYSVPQRLLVGKNRYVNDKVLAELMHCKTTDEFIEIMQQTKYKRFREKYPDCRLDILAYKVLYSDALHSLHFSTYSCVVLFSLIIILGIEYSDLATIIESKRYNLPPESVTKILINDVKE